MSQEQSQVPYLLESKIINSIYLVTSSVLQVYNGSFGKEMKLAFFGGLKRHPLVIIFRVPLAWSPKLFLALLWIECYDRSGENATISISIEAHLEDTTRVCNVYSMRHRYFDKDIQTLERLAEVSVSVPFILGGTTKGFG